jgi:hypothetical protein
MPKYKFPKAWGDAIRQLHKVITSEDLNEKSAIHTETVVYALTGWVDTDVADSESNSHQAIGNRATWIFTGGYTLTVGAGIPLTIAHLSDEMNADSFPKLKNVDPKNWSFNKGANGWSRKKPLPFIHLAGAIEILHEEFGQTALILPIESWFETLDDEMWLDDDLDDDLEAFWLLLSILNDEKLFETLQEGLGYRIAVTGADDFFPEHSDYKRFWSLVEELDERDEWFVNVLECCSECAAEASAKNRKANPGRKEIYEFLTMGQGQNTYNPDGTVGIQAWVTPGEGERQLKQLARDYGFDLGEWEGAAFEEEGEVWFGE